MPGDGVVASATACLDVRFLIAEHSDGVGCIAEGVGGRSELPSVLHYLPKLATVGFYLTVAEQTENVIEAEINFVDFA